MKNKSDFNNISHFFRVQSFYCHYTWRTRNWSIFLENQTLCPLFSFLTFSTSSCCVNSSQIWQYVSRSQFLNCIFFIIVPLLTLLEEDLAAGATLLLLLSTLLSLDNWTEINKLIEIMLESFHMEIWYWTTRHFLMLNGIEEIRLLP